MLHAGCSCTPQGQGCIDPPPPSPSVHSLPTMGTSLSPSLNPAGQVDLAWDLWLDTPIAVTAPHCLQGQHSLLWG